MRCLRQRCAAGFTFIEVVIVLLILAIAAAMALPLLGDTGSTRLREAARLLVADLAYAQVESVSHGDNPRGVVFDTAHDRYRVVALSDTTTAIINPIGQQAYVTRFGQGRAESLAGVSIAGYELDGDEVLGFGLYGQLDQTSDATITLACEGRQVTVTVDATTGETMIGDIE
jgi:prepilin-type N-terminal cleavage/methylation domain-containing protein